TDSVSPLPQYFAEFAAASPGLGATAGPSLHGLAPLASQVAATLPQHEPSGLAFMGSSSHQPHRMQPMLTSAAEPRGVLGFRAGAPGANFGLGGSHSLQSASPMPRNPDPEYAAMQLHSQDLYSFGGIASTVRPLPSAAISMHDTRPVPGSYYPGAAYFAHANPDAHPQNAGHFMPGTANFALHAGAQHSAFGPGSGMFQSQSPTSMGGRPLGYGSHSPGGRADNDGRESSLGSEGNGEGPSARSRTGYWKNRPRNSISRTQKQIFYAWLLEHTSNPFPSDNDRMGVLYHDAMTERQFKYWFANIRCRQFSKHRNNDGNLYFMPAAKFYESCIRLGLPINHEIPAEIQREMKFPRRQGGRRQ
ncbi:hypothetical protein IWQ56_004405, partial [Coemansia nantahalensis]